MTSWFVLPCDTSVQHTLSVPSALWWCHSPSKVRQCQVIQITLKSKEPPPLILSTSDPDNSFPSCPGQHFHWNPVSVEQVWKTKGSGCKPPQLLPRTNSTFPICWGNDLRMCIWEKRFSRVDKLSPFPDFRGDLLSVSFHQGEEPFTDLEEMARPQITWKFQNICSSNDYYVNSESCWGIVPLCRSGKGKATLCLSLVKDKSGFWKGIFNFPACFLQAAPWIFPDVEKTAFADMYKSLFYKQQLLWNSKIAKT